MTPAEVREQLFAKQDLKYRDFTAKLLPNVEKERIIGVRAPEITRLSRQLRKEGGAEEFLASLPHAYFEEDNLHAALLSAQRDTEALFPALETFLPYVDNWATCDTLRPAVFKKHPAVLPGKIRRWMEAEHPYTVRFGIGMLMSYYLDDAFLSEYPARVAAVQSDEYYVNMMIAWYFATALAKQYDAVIPYLEEHRLSRWCHNKTIQKAIESHRISDGHKAYLRALRIQ